MEASGTHILIDCYGASDPGEESLTILRNVAALANCNVVEEVEHIFKGGGRTAALILSQSHTTIHGWPEKQFVGFDIYSCRDLSEKETKLIATFLKQAVKAARTKTTVIPRGNDF